ncbi:MAG: multiheme c-type cytochrome [Planctomycetota bacterium]
MNKSLLMLVTVACLLNPAVAYTQTTVPEKEISGCMACHEGIEAIRESESLMMRQIVAAGRAKGDADGCVICHGGDVKATTKEAAHSGNNFFAAPGSPWVNESTCGQCHPRHVDTQWTSLMMSESGKIQGTCWSFGGLEGYNHGWGNYDVENPSSPMERVGSNAYREYMERLKKLEPGAYPDEQKTLPHAPTDLSALKEHPEWAAFTYIRSECQRCHLAVRGRKERGDYRGMGCSACHIPYGNEGLYEGQDPSIPKDQPGHLLVHSIQATREAKVTVNGKTYSGIPVETCTTCHDRGKRVGVSFQGLMESAYESPFTEGGEDQLPLHTKHYIAMHADIHSSKGMVCHDCHTSIDVHGDGFIAGTNLAQIQIECTDCHGTTRLYPWELPLGYGDEFDTPPQSGEPREVATDLPPHLRQGTVYPTQDGYLLTARGNPMPEVVRQGDRVVVHTAGGKDLELKPLKLMIAEGDLKPKSAGWVAMHQVEMHQNKMECYSCHAEWMPQCYGCHLKIDYSQGNQSFDWVGAGHRHLQAKHKADNSEIGYDTVIPGKVIEQRSYMRWEAPALGVNGEGRICTVTAGCQPSITVIGPTGETILLNHIFRTPPNTEGAGPEGQLAIDMSPGQPHTTGEARSCESCHLSEKALGYGINGGRISGPWDEPLTIDLKTADGELLSKSARPQIEPIAGLEADWSRFVSEDGKQLKTVGHHWSRSRPLNNEERANMDRQGLCRACHQEIPTESLAVSILHHVADYADALPKTADEHSDLIHKTLLIAGWGQVAGMAMAPVVVVFGLVWFRRRRRRKAGGRRP